MGAHECVDVHKSQALVYHRTFSMSQQSSVKSSTPFHTIICMKNVIKCITLKIAFGCCLFHLASQSFRTKLIINWVAELWSGITMWQTYETADVQSVAGYQNGAWDNRISAKLYGKNVTTVITITTSGALIHFSIRTMKCVVCILWEWHIYIR